MIESGINTTGKVVISLNAYVTLDRAKKDRIEKPILGYACSLNFNKMK